MTQDQIKKRLQIISDLTAELNSLKSTYEEMLEEDSEYQEFYKKEQEYREEKKEEQNRITSKSVYMALKDEMKDLRRDINENKEALAIELLEHYRDSGILEVTDHEGNTKKIKFTVRLIG